MRLVEVREAPPDPLVEEQHAGEPILKLIAIRRTRTTVNASAKGVRGLRFESMTHPPFELKLVSAMRAKFGLNVGRGDTRFGMGQRYPSGVFAIGSTMSESSV